MDNLDPQYRGSLDAAARLAIAYLDSLEKRPVAAPATLAEIRERLGKPLAAEGLDPVQVIEELARDAEGGLHATSGGRFFAWVIGGTLPAALAADWLTAAWDQNAAMHTTAPAAAVVEEIAAAWLAEIFGLPEGCGFALVTGCQMAHVTCLAAARHALLARRGWDVDRRGLCYAPGIRILAGERHGTVDRAARLLGIGLDNIASLGCDEDGRLLAGALEQALAEDPGIPSIVLLQAGDINTGVYDRFAEISEVAHRSGAWVHVDGAIGLWAAASRHYRHLTKGLEQCDSWATDGHKWLNVPYDCGYAFVADAAAQRASMSHSAPYLTYDSGARDVRGVAPVGSCRRGGNDRSLLPARARASYPNRRVAGRGAGVDTGDQSGAGTIPGFTRERDGSGSRTAHGRGDCGDSRLGRSVFRSQHMAREAGHAGQRKFVADDG
jgi:glutamate/tyrosine decarboxylase-like PLP-dependent enzyme